MKKISIMGTKYDVALIPDNADYWGECDGHERLILLTKDKYVKYETIAHELLHAYLYQCGLDELAGNEVLHHAFGRFFEEFVCNYKILQKLLPKLEKIDK